MPTDLTYPYATCWEKIFKGSDNQGPYYKISFYFTNWAWADTVVNELKGITTYTGNTVFHAGPHQFPLSPNLCCTDVQIEGCGNAILSSDGWPSYDAGFFAHCEYRPISWLPFGTADPGNNNQIDPANPILWCTQELDFETETYVSETNKYVWSTSDGLNGQPTDVPIQVPVTITTMTLTFPNLPYLPLPLIRQYRNNVNSVAFLGSQPGYLRFMGGKTVRETNTDGSTMQRCVLQFKERSVPWNYFLRKDILAWALVKDSSGNTVFQSADLSQIVFGPNGGVYS